MKKYDIYLDAVVISVLIISIIGGGFWYYTSLNLAKERAATDINGILRSCESLPQSFSDCDLAEESYDLSAIILCGKDMKKALGEVIVKIDASYNLWEVWDLSRMKPMNPYEALDIEKNTLGELNAGNAYFISAYKRKLNQLFESGALTKPCEQNRELLRNYVECDWGDIKMALPESRRRELPAKYMKDAEWYLDGMDYLATVTYGTAAVAFQDQLTRNYYEVLAFSGDIPVCLK